MLPQAFTANERIYRQPVAEAACSAEIQRVVSIFRLLYMWCQRERWGARFSVRRLFVLTVDSIESNHVAMRILKWCLKNGDIQRVNPLMFLNANLPWDDFEANHFGAAADLVNANLEFFGVTRNVVLRPSLLTRAYDGYGEGRRAEGIVADNRIYNMVVRRLNIEELDQYLNRCDLLTTVLQMLGDNIGVSYPGYIKYTEEFVPYLRVRYFHQIQFYKRKIF